MVSESSNLLVKMLDGIKIPGKYIKKEGNVEIFRDMGYEKQFFLPANPCKGMGILLANKDGNVESLNKDYTGALCETAYRSKIRKLDKSLNPDSETKADPLQNIVYYRFLLGGVKNIDNEQEIKVWSAVFCCVLDILKPTKFIVDGKKIGEFLVSALFEEVAKDVWNVAGIGEGEILRKYLSGCKFIGLPNKRVDPKKDRELQHLRQIINDLGSVIADVKVVFDLVAKAADEVIEEDMSRSRFTWLHLKQKGTLYNYECLCNEEFHDKLLECDDKLYATNRLIDIWENLKEMKFRLQNNKYSDRATDAIEKVTVFKKLLEYLQVEKKQLPCASVNAAITYVKWLDGKRVVNGKGKIRILNVETDEFRKILTWALGDKKERLDCNFGGMNFEEMPSVTNYENGVDGKLNSVYKYFVTNISPRNSHYADLMERSFITEDGSLWKPKPELWQKKIPYGDNIPYENYLVDGLDNIDEHDGFCVEDSDRENV